MTKIKTYLIPNGTEVHFFPAVFDMDLQTECRLHVRSAGLTYQTTLHNLNRFSTTTGVTFPIGIGIDIDLILSQTAAQQQQK